VRNRLILTILALAVVALATLAPSASATQISDGQLKAQLRHAKRHLRLARERAQKAGADLAAAGLPLGGWSSAPAAVRAASQRYAGWLAGAGRETGVRVVDYGDVAVDAADLGATFVRAHEHLADVLAAGATPLPLGGDASITVPALQVLAGKLQGRPGSSARRAPGCGKC